MNTVVPSSPFTNLQHELMKLFDMNVSDNELLDIKHLIGTYFIQKASKDADQVRIEKGYNEETLKKLLNKE